ncbi:MAG: aminotransferase class III-fold pyridoxal phosphate-dependent enzyme [Candidatus Eremiobacteraeota bacterium]|nr:aminotransferase class III-fold pyridoxal phosphate-dependent enzyme [Candidatus Eremiobacteraeota bacterium]
MAHTPSALWLPFTQMGEFEPSDRTFVRAEGNYLFDATGRRIFDAVSSIWTTVHGHCHPYIVEQITRQAATLDHSTLLGATNPVAEELAARLTQLTRTDHAFFSSDGASAIEVALKIAIQYWQNSGEPQRTRFVHLVDAYHGDTAGAMSVSDIALFKSRFAPLTFETVAYGEVTRALDSPDVAAFIVEPIVQAAAGIRIVPHSAYARFKQISPLLIVDEVATGFGRTGTLFASEQLDIEPDIVCVGKGITGGTLALSATLVRERVYAAFLGNHAQRRHLFHGHSYAGNPIACAAALANLELFATERTLEAVASVARAISVALERTRAKRLVREVRQAGLMIGIELRAEEIAPRGASAAWDVADAMYARGYFTRPIGDTVQLVPPLSSTSGELCDFLAALDETLGP